MIATVLDNSPPDSISPDTELSDCTALHHALIDCLEWSCNLLTKLLSNHTILDGEGNIYLKTKKIKKLEGEAYVNVRKGKIIPSYEISLSLSFLGEAKDSDGKSLLVVDGTVKVLYIFDENVDENPEVRVLVKDKGPIGRRLNEAFMSKGKQFVLKQIRVYVSAMAKGGPTKDELEVKNVNPVTKKVAAPATVAVVEVKNEEKKMSTNLDAFEVF